MLQEPQRGLGTVWGYRGGRVPPIREIGRRNAHDGGDGSNSGSLVLWRTQERRKDFSLLFRSSASFPLKTLFGTQFVCSALC